MGAEAHCHVSASGESQGHTDSLGKDQNSTSEVPFLLNGYMCGSIIKSIHVRSKHHKSVTVYYFSWIENCHSLPNLDSDKINTSTSAIPFLFVYRFLLMCQIQGTKGSKNRK